MTQLLLLAKNIFCDIRKRVTMKVNQVMKLVFGSTLQSGT